MRPILLACLLLMAIANHGIAQLKQSNTSSLLISANEFQQVIQKQNVQILDVRTAAEFASGHIKNALQANWNDAKEFESRTQHLDKKQKLYIYCLAGGRSAAAQAFLIQKGFEVVNLEGGLSNWKMNNLPVEGNANQQQMRVADFDKVIASNNLVLVDIGANWCPPCRKMLPIIDRIKNAQGDKLYFLAVDGGIDVEVMKHVQFESLPTFIIYKNGREVWRSTGIVEEAAFTAALESK